MRIGSNIYYNEFLRQMDREADKKSPFATLQDEMDSIIFDRRKADKYASIFDNMKKAARTGVIQV